MKERDENEVEMKICVKDKVWKRYQNFPLLLDSLFELFFFCRLGTNLMIGWNETV
jgi:hypothetical protein